MRTIFRQRLWVFALLSLLAWGRTLFWQPPDALAQLETLVVAVAIEPPFVWEDESGALTGFDIDLINALADQADLPISYTKAEFRYLLPGVATRLYDVASACLFITPERQAQVNITKPYFATGFTLVIQATTAVTVSLANLTSEMSVGVIEGSAVQDLLQTQNTAQVQTVLTLDDAFAKVEGGELQAAIVTETALWGYKLHHPETTLKTIGNLLTYNECGLAVNQADGVLLAQLDSALTEIKSNGVYDTLYRKWFDQRPPPEKPVEPPPADAAALPTPTPVATSTPVTATAELAGIYYLTNSAEPAPEAGGQAGARHQILTLAANGIWFVTETADPVAAPGALAATQTGQPGLWYVNAQGQVEAMLLTFTSPAVGTAGSAVIRKDYQMQVDSNGTVVGAYHAAEYPADLFALPTVPTAILTQTVEFTGQRVQ